MNQWTCRIALTGMSLMGVSAFAQNADPLNSGDDSPTVGEQAQPTDQSGRLPITVTAGGSQQFKADIDKNNAGSFSISRAKVGVKVPVRLNDNFTLSTTARYALDYFDFDAGAKNFLGVTWDDINTIAAASVLSWNDKDSAWSYYGGGFVKMSAESGASLNRSANGGGLGGFNYKFNDNLTLGAGVAVMSVLEENAAVLPLVTARWKFAENWVLNAGLTDVATAGYGVDVKWLFNKDWDFSLGGQVHRSRFRIDGNSANGTQNSIATEESGTIYAASTLHATSEVDLTAFAGAAVGGKLKLADSKGNHEQKADYKSAAIIGLQAAFKF